MGLDYYNVLNVPRQCSENEIKLAYRKYAIATHPKREPYPLHPDNPPEGVPDQITHLPSLPLNTIWEYVNEAYDVLSHPLRRAVYDIYGEEGLKRGTSAPEGFIQPYVYHGNYMQTYAMALGSESPYADLVDAITFPPPLYETVHGQRGVKCKDPPIDIALPLTLKEVFYGGLKKIKVHRSEFCDELRQRTEMREHMFLIPIPAGIRQGCRITFEEAGDRGPLRVPADIHFVVEDAAHDVFRRDGADLYMEHKVKLQQSLCGFVVEVKTVDDRAFRVPIVDVIEQGYVKMVPNEGLPKNGVDGAANKGNLYISFVVDFPTNLSKECREKMAALFADADCL